VNGVLTVYRLAAYKTISKASLYSIVMTKSQHIKGASRLCKIAKMSTQVLIGGVVTVLSAGIVLLKNAAWTSLR